MQRPVNWICTAIKVMRPYWVKQIQSPKATKADTTDVISNDSNKLYDTFSNTMERKQKMKNERVLIINQEKKLYKGFEGCKSTLMASPV